MADHGDVLRLPGAFEIKEATLPSAAYRSSTRRHYLDSPAKRDVPDPGAYNIPSSFDKIQAESRVPFNSGDKRFRWQEASSAAPNVYYNPAILQTGAQARNNASASFRSTSERFPRAAPRAVPDPGSYDLPGSMNQGGASAAFRSTTQRLAPSRPAWTDAPGAAYYPGDIGYNASRAGDRGPSAAYRSGTQRLLFQRTAERGAHAADFSEDPNSIGAKANRARGQTSAAFRSQSDRFRSLHTPYQGPQSIATYEITKAP